MEHEIGTRITLEVVRDTDGEGCRECFFSQIEVCPEGIECSKIDREDGEEVYYRIVSIYPKTATK